MSKRILTAGWMAAILLGTAGAGALRAEDAKAVAAEKMGGVGKVAIGEAAPEIEAVGLDGKAVKLSDFLGKPVVLQFGSLTEPVFRMRVGDSEKMAGAYGDKVTFLVVYSKEAHAADGENSLEANVAAGFGIAGPVNEDERVKLAKQAVERLKIVKQTVVVDAWSDASRLGYGGYPNMTFVIDGKGKVQAGFAWMDAGKVKGALDAILAGKEVPVEDRGQTKPGVPGELDYAAAVNGAGGNRGNQLVLVIDHIVMTDKQKAAVYPALGDYLAAGRTFREKFGNGRPGGAAPGGKAAPKAAGAGGAAAGGAKDGAPDMAMDGKKADGGAVAAPAKDEGKSPEDFQADLEKLRAAAQNLKKVVKENLSEKDAGAVMEALEQGPAKRLFADSRGRVGL